MKQRKILVIFLTILIPLRLFDQNCAVYHIQSKSGYFDTGFFCPIVFFCRQVSVKIVLFVIQLENNRIYLSSGFFVYRITLSFWQCNQMDKMTRFRLYKEKIRRKRSLSPNYRGHFVWRR